LVIAEPPVPPATYATDSWAFVDVTTPTVGANGTVTGIPGTARDARLAPELLVARIATKYEVPLTNGVAATALMFVITSGESTDTGLRAVHVTPASVEYW